LHSSESLAAVGLITGELELWKYDDQEDRCKGKSVVHSESCRVVKFSEDGSKLYSGSADRSINVMDLEGKVLWKHSDAHSSAVNCLASIEESSSLLLSGDEMGEIKLWDARQKSAALSSLQEQTDYISDMVYTSAKKTLLVTSGDGSLGVFDLKKGMTKLASKQISGARDDDYLSMQIVKNGSKVVIGTQDGILNFYNWGEWGDLVDRFPGHPSSIESMLKVDESTVCTGSMDGMIRIVNIFPHKLLGVIGDHTDFPIERLAWTHDRRAIASSSHDSKVRFWDASCLVEDEDEDEDEEDEESDGSETSEEKPKKKRKGELDPAQEKRKAKIEHKEMSSASAKNRDFFSDI